jgi:hypothetical protein
MKIMLKKSIALVLLTSAFATQAFGAQQVFVGYEDSAPYVAPVVQKPAQRPVQAQPVIQPEAQPITPVVAPATNVAVTSAPSTETTAYKITLQKIKDFFNFGGTKPAANVVAGDAQPAVASLSFSEKTRLQKFSNLSGAFVRGALRGLSGFGACFNCVGKITNVFGNVDAFIDMILDGGQVRVISELIAGDIDDTNEAVITEEVTAAFIHAFIPYMIFSKNMMGGKYKSSARGASSKYKKRISAPDFCLAFVNRLIQKLPALDTRKAEGIKKYALLAARFVTESINTNAFAFRSKKRSDFAEELPRWFNPLVGLTAVGRTLFIDWVINKREAAGTLTDVQSIKRTRTMLTGLLSLLNLPAKAIDDYYLSFLDCKILGGRNTSKRK